MSQPVLLFEETANIFNPFAAGIPSIIVSITKKNSGGTPIDFHFKITSIEES